MYNQFKRIEKEFKIESHISEDKIKKAREKKISINSLNYMERQVTNYNKTYLMLPYNTNEGGLVSYYLIEFCSSCIVDILKINITERENSGYFFHSVHSKNGDREKENSLTIVVKKILDKDSFLSEFGPIGYGEHSDLAYILDPKRNSGLYFEQ